MLAKMYITLMPIILTAVVNAVFCKSTLLDFLKVPIDRGRTAKDGKRYFGDNKTWKGFLATIVFDMIIMVLWGVLAEHNTFLAEHNFFYVNYENTMLYNMFMGGLMGLVYAALELPNSFIKRRLEISSGKQGRGLRGLFFAIYDQVDSLLGVILIVAIVYDMSFAFYFMYVVVAGVSHLLLNSILYGLHLRKNIL